MRFKAEITRWNTLSAVAAAAVIAAAITLMPGSDVNASAPVAAKADRADLQQDCAQQDWPYYKTTCLRDDSRNAGRVLKLRLVSTDRIAQVNPNTKPDLAPHWPIALAELQVAVPPWAK